MGVGVAVGVAVGVLVGVAVAVGNGVALGAGVGVGVLVGVAVLVGTAVAVGNDVALGAGVDVGADAGAQADNIRLTSKNTINVRFILRVLLWRSSRPTGDYLDSLLSCVTHAILQVTQLTADLSEAIISRGKNGVKRSRRATASSCPTRAHRSA